MRELVKTIREHVWTVAMVGALVLSFIVQHQLNDEQLMKQRKALVEFCNLSNDFRRVVNEASNVTVEHNDVTADRFRELGRALLEVNDPGARRAAVVALEAAGDYEHIKTLYVQVGLLDCERDTPRLH